MSTNKLRRDLADLTRTVGDAKACRDCRGVQYMGAPGLFVSLWIPRKHGDPRGRAHTAGARMRSSHATSTAAPRVGNR